MGSLGPSMVSVQHKVAAKPVAAAAGQEQQAKDRCGSGGGGGYGGFQMPVHYPRYKKADYEGMPEWRVDCLLREYGLPVAGDVEDKRRFAMGAFLWPDQY